MQTRSCQSSMPSADCNISIHDVICVCVLMQTGGLGNVVCRKAAEEKDVCFGVACVCLDACVMGGGSFYVLALEAGG